MTQSAFSVRMDEGLKREFSAFCENVGMNMSTAIVIFAKTVVREHQFPFAISERPIMERRNRTDEIDDQARTQRRKIVKRSKRASSLFKTLRSCPFGGVELNIERDHGFGREVAFA